MTGYPAWPELFRWLTVLKDRVEQLPSISAEQVITGTLDPSVIPPIPWDLVLKAGSSLGDLETRSAGDLSSGTLLDARMPALTGDVSSVAGTVATTLATVNLSPGSYGSGTLVPIVTVNEKGLVTDVMTTPVVLVSGGYTIGDLLYANSATTLSALHDVAAGSYLRSGGVATAPLWSTLKLPNAGAVGDLPFVSSTNIVTMLSDVAVGSVLVSGGVTTAPAWSNTPVLTKSVTVQADPASGTDFTTGYFGLSAAGTRQYFRLQRAPNFSGSLFGARIDGDTTQCAAAIEFYETSSDRFTTNFIGRGNDNPGLFINTDSSYNRVINPGGQSNNVHRLGIGGGNLNPTGLLEADLHVFGNVYSTLSFGELSGTVFGHRLFPTFTDQGTNSSTIAYGLEIKPTVNYTGGTKTGHYEAIRIAVLETSVPTGTNYLFRALGGASATTEFFSVTNAGVGYFYGALTINGQGSTGAILTTDAANIPAFKNGTTQQQLRVYGTTTGSRYLNITHLGTTSGAAITTGDGTAISIGTTNAQANFNVPAVFIDGGGFLMGAATASADVSIRRTGAGVLRIGDAGGSGAATLTVNTKFGVGLTGPTAQVHISAGTATANTAPLKFNSGTNLTTAEAGAIEFTTDDYFATITTGAARKGIVLDDGARLTSGRIPVATTNGRLIDSSLRTPVTGRSTAQVAAVASVVTTTLAAADGSVLVGANVNVTASTLHSFSVQVDYTDETNTAQTLTLTFSQLSAALVSVITNATGAGPYEGLPLQIRCKASTAITIKTTGTFTTVTYNVEGAITQIA